MERPPSKWLWVALLLVFVLGGLGCCVEGCLEEEKVALLQLKPFFYRRWNPNPLNIGRPFFYALYNWVEEKSDCCKWESVECDPTTGRVIGLNLSVGLGNREAEYNGFDLWYLNASLFLPFDHLKSLYLRGSGIAGCLQNHGFDKLTGKLKKLEALDLSFNYFDDSNILSSLLEFSSLKSLNLTSNYLTGPIHTDGFGGLSTNLSSIENLDLSYNWVDDSILLALSGFPSLKHLDLSRNHITGSSHIGAEFKELSKLTSLETLHLSENGELENNMLSHLGDLPSLKTLGLENCGLNGTTHIQGFKGLSRLKSLETLYLSGNEMLGTNILSYVGNLSSLKTLYMERCGLEGTIQIQELNNLINLKELYLSGNRIESFGSFLEDGRQSGLINLELLSLTLNVFNNSILSSLGPFSKSLKRLYIYGYSFSEGSIDIEDARERGLKNVKGAGLVAVQAANNSFLPQSLIIFPLLKSLHFESYVEMVTLEGLPNLNNLEELLVDGPSLYTNILEDIGKLNSLRVLSLRHSETNLSIQGLFHLKNLESLEMSELSLLENNFFEKIGALNSLKMLSLSNCELNGTLPTQGGICNLASLEELDINHNSLVGTLPDCFSNLTFLRRLDLSSNQFSGNLSLSSLKMASMEYTDLSNNQFQIPSSLQPFFNHSKLKHFNGDNNHIFADQTELHSLAPQFQLNFISLSCCGNGGTLPKFLHYQHELQYVYLTHINLTGEFPSWLLENNTQLETLMLLNNSLLGHLKLPFHPSMKLSELDISDNFLDGHIPIEFGKYLSGLGFLNISKNSLDGGIPSSIGDMKLLQVLDLSNNRLSGIIPESLAMNCSNLQVLMLSNNRLQGQMFSSNFRLTKLKQLQLASNNFTGVIPNSLANCSVLLKIDIGDNHISGRIPQWIGNLTFLQEIIMVNNHIEGPIPMEICNLGVLKLLDISINNISGTLPPCLSSNWFNHLHLSRNRLQGPIPDSLCNRTNMVTLDLSQNQFSGNIPTCIGELSQLRYLVLGHNKLEGEIPHQLCQLDLSLIDLSHNNLSGVIPSCLNVTAFEEVAGDSTNYLGPPWVVGSMSFVMFSMDGSIMLTTKNISYSYKGKILRFLSGINLAFNKLIGNIPQEMGYFHDIVMLNLSHNSLSGAIPPSLSKLGKIESLDLSYNNLSGSIPRELVELYSLAYFNVSYNNLSGKPPPRSAQFASDFDENSYWGNPLLCGEPLPKTCSKVIEPSSSNSTKEHDDDQEDGGFMDVESFYVTFAVSHTVVLLGIVAVLYINPYWRQAWFYFIERVITTCLYFVKDKFSF